MADNLALVGDAMLRAAVLQVLGAGDVAAARAGRLSKGALTTRASNALTNAHLAAAAAPALLGAGVLSAADLAAVPSDHARATALEAAVAAVAAGGGAAAVACLARALVAAAPAAPDVPAKTALLEAGGAVTTERAGGPDHAPLWRARATLRDAVARTQAPRASKRAAEAEAAVEVMRLAGVPLPAGADYHDALDDGPADDAPAEAAAPPLDAAAAAQLQLLLTPEPAEPWLQRADDAAGRSGAAVWLRSSLQARVCAACALAWRRLLQQQPDARVCRGNAPARPAMCLRA